MKAKHKPTYTPHFSGSFDSIIKDAISKAKGVPYVEKVKLYNAILDACKTQVNDCCDAITASFYLALHDEYGFGKKRVRRLKDKAQHIADTYADRYDVGMMAALHRDLAAYGIIIQEREGTDL